MALNPKYTLNMEGHAPTYRERKPRGWTRFYHSDYLKVFAVAPVAYPIWVNKNLDVPLLSGGAFLKGTATVKTVNMASAVVICTITSTIGIATPFATQNLLLNGANIYSMNYNPSSISLNIDVTNLITDGPNEFLFEVGKLPLIGWGLVTITLNLQITADSSSVSPPPPWEMWPSWWPYAAAGAGLAVVGGVILLRRKR